MKIVNTLVYTEKSIVATARLYDGDGTHLESAEGWHYGLSDPFARERALASAYEKLVLERRVAMDASEWEIVQPPTHA